MIMSGHSIFARQRSCYEKTCVNCGSQILVQRGLACNSVEVAKCRAKGQNTPSTCILMMLAAAAPQSPSTVTDVRSVMVM